MKEKSPEDAAPIFMKQKSDVAEYTLKKFFSSKTL